MKMALYNLVHRQAIVNMDNLPEQDTLSENLLFFVSRGEFMCISRLSWD